MIFKYEKLPNFYNYYKRKYFTKIKKKKKKVERRFLEFSILFHGVCNKFNQHKTHKSPEKIGNNFLRYYDFRVTLLKFMLQIID